MRLQLGGFLAVLAAANLLFSVQNVSAWLSAPSAVTHHRLHRSPEAAAVWQRRRAGTRLLSSAIAASSGGSSPPPSDFSVVDDDEDDGDSFSDVTMHFESSSQGKSKIQSSISNVADYDDYEETSSSSSVTSKSPKRPKRLTVSRSRASWMERNAEFVQEEKLVEPVVVKKQEPAVGTSNVWRNTIPEDNSKLDAASRPPNQTFRRNFRGTRVFVQGLPSDVSWQDLKDHFKEAGTVVFASVSMDPRTGVSKGHGIVQYETTEMAQTAIAIMRDYPLNGHALYVREDVQEQKEGSELRAPMPAGRSTSSVPTKWTCADEENASFLSLSDKETVLSMIKARDDSRRRRNYDASDAIRDDLKQKFGVHLDDRLKMWWTSLDGKNVPRVLKDIKGEGRWGLKAWRQIPTTPENDACVNADLVAGLLDQRDIARREKDFATADALLEEARTCPDGDLTLRIHDESRTWRIWTDAPPPRPVSHQQDLSPGEQCIEIVKEHAPEKVDEVRMILEKFPGREWGVLKKLRQRYLQD